MKMVSRIVLVVFVLLTTNFMINAQSTFGHEWIDANKTYYKLKVAQNGIYKVTHEELILAGFPSGNISGASLKLMNFGQEQAIYVSDNDFGPGDYFEFYGEKNTIGLDSLLYNNWSKDLFNPEYSLVTDTNAYFLTLSPETSNLRYTLVNPDYNSNTLAPFPYYLHTEKIVFSNTYFKNVDGDVRYSHFEPSEGFGDALQQTSSTVLNTSLFVDSGPNPVLSFRLGQNNHLSKLEISWNNQLKESIITLPKLTSQFTYTLDKSEIKSGNTLGLKNTNSANDRHRLAYVSLVYPRSFDFGNKSEFTFSLPAASGKRYLEISAFKTDNDQLFVYDINKKIRYTTKINGGKVLAIVNPSTTDAKYIISNSSSGARKVNSIHVFRPKSYTDSGQEYIIISNKSLYATGPDYVKDYSDYRSSTIGGGYKTEIIEIQDVYDHFAYGIERHFLGIKQLTGYMKQNWKQAKFVMILGKGIEYPYMRTNNDVINNENLVFFVPTFGYVGSDNMLFSEKNFPDPQFAIGRVAARSAEDIKNYLDKVKQYDQARLAPQTIEDKYWMKRVLHLGGGGNVFEQSAIKNGLLNMENIIEQSMMGGEVNTYYKTSTDVLQSAKIDDIKKLINTGINMLTFFGHSAPGTWDFNVEDPSKFENFGRYPLINSLGCFSGNIHSTSQGLSERFVLTKDKGSIAFLASSGTAFISQLSNYGYNFYNKLGNKKYGITIGEVLNEILRENKDLQYAEYAFNQQQTFHGDPAISLYHFDGPDYVFDYNSFSIEPRIPNSTTEKISVSFELVNLGKYFSRDSVEIRFLHQLPSGKIIDTIYLKVPAPRSRTKYYIDIKGQGINGLGKNILFGEIDPDKKLTELPTPESLNNNLIGQNGFVFYIYDNSAFPIYPSEFAIVGNLENLVLKASTNNAALIKSRYFFEIDTTELFNSPILQNSTVESLGGVISYRPSLVKLPNTVYYWRVKADSTDDFKTNWLNSSFIYLPGEKEGWNQSHFYQYKKDAYNFLYLRDDSKKFDFGNKENSVRLRNKYFEESDKPGYLFNFVLYRSVFTAWEFMQSGIAVVVNSKSGSKFFPLKNLPGGTYGAFNPTGSNLDVFPFKTDSFEDRKKLMEFIENEIKEDYYINLFTIIPNPQAELKVDEWANDSIILGKNIFSVLEKFGAAKIRKLLEYGSVPYVLQAHNGEEGLIAEEISSTKGGIVDVNSILNVKTSSGSLTSTLIGPASAWSELDIKYSELNSLYDTAYVNIYGITADNKLDLLYGKITSKTTLNINANEYQYIKLESFKSDPVDKSSPQLDYWRIYYKPMPEAALAPYLSYSFMNDTLQEGELLSMKVGIENINKIGMDSLLIHFTVSNAQNKEEHFQKKISSLGAYEKGEINFTYPTQGKVGLNQLVIEMNPNNDQPEVLHTNNFFIKSFFVEKDNRNPLLDVYFDNVKIMDGDIVSPKPEIKITLGDDNIFLPVADPSLFSIQLDTGRNNLLEIPHNDPRIKFSPSTGADQPATLLFNPQLKSGEYKLIVQAQDASGNKSGLNSKIVNFRVIEKQSISNILNYPNPFSTSTQFVFTLTGEEIPDIMSISIMTISGKTVKEITKEELGPLHIGTNRTEYKWDGTDEYGSKLANGVYLYKVNTRKRGGDKYDQYTNTKTDVFFKDGFGKLVILR